DLVGGHDGIGQEGLGVGMFQERHGGPSRRISSASEHNPCQINAIVESVTVQIGRCDGKMVVADWIEGEAWNALAEILMEPGRLEVAIEAMADDRIAGRVMADLTQIEKQLADARESQEVLYAEYVRALKGKQNALAERLKSDWMLAEATVAQFEQTAKDYKNRIEARTDTKALAERFRQRLDRLPA